MKSLTVVLVVTIVCGLIISTGISNGKVGSFSKSLPATSSPLKNVVNGGKTPDKILGISNGKVGNISKSLPATSSPLKNVVNGEKTPDKIPDQVGYSLLFAIVSGRTNDADKERARAFIRRMGLSEEEIDQLIAAAEEFRERARPLEREGDRIKGRNHPNHLPLTNHEVSRLGQLQKQRDDLTNQVAESLEHRLGKNGAGKVRRFVRSVMKRKIKIME